LRLTLLAAEALPRAPRQRRSREKRVQLKAAALALFAEKGYEETSIDDTADRAHLAIGTVYQHFRSKRQLLLFLMDELLEQLTRLDLEPKASSDRRTALRAVFARAMAGDLQYVGAYRAWHEAALTDADLAHKEAEIHAWTTARLLSVLHFLEKLPHARPGADRPGLATVLDGLFWSLLVQASRASDLERERWIDAATHLMYHALFTDPPRRAVRSRWRRKP
jgi:AcrR family transcriptional regulator